MVLMERAGSILGTVGESSGTAIYAVADNLVLHAVHLKASAIT